MLITKMIVEPEPGECIDFLIKYNIKLFQQLVLFDLKEINFRFNGVNVIQRKGQTAEEVLEIYHKTLSGEINGEDY